MHDETEASRLRTAHLVEAFEQRFGEHARSSGQGSAARRVLDEAQRRGGCKVLVVRAPGRVNLIGEHTDYNEGFVLPIAIDYDVRFAVCPRADRRVHLHSLDYDADTEFDLDDVQRDDQAWGSYARGVAVELMKAGYLVRGMEGVVQGNVPIGSGLSSSAAMEVASALAFCAASQQSVDPVELAKICQAAENHYVGVRSGIMDQFASRMGNPNHAIFLDCRSLEHELVPVQSDECVFVVTNSGESRELAASAYNERRAECEAAVEALKHCVPDVKSLRDVRPHHFTCAEKHLDPVILRRARHVVTENDRVLRAVQALREGELACFGQLMNESHDSLRDDYEVSSAPLDTLVEASRAVEGCYGSRLTGAGFGGCTVSLVRVNRVDAFRTAVSARYREACGKQAEFYVTRPAAGAGVVRRDPQ
jgi:galactokinase